MNDLAKQFYSGGKDSKIQEVLVLHEKDGKSWNELSEKFPDLPRSWFELSRVAREERVEFMCDCWLERLPFHPIAHPFLFQFFSRLDDLVVVLVKQDNEFHPEMVYSLVDNRTFFRGLPPAIDQDIATFKTEMRSNLPSDYLSFLRLHNGFGKLSEMGVLTTEEVFIARDRVRALLMNASQSIRWEGNLVDPESLIPFYKEEGLDSFQCFFADWYPTNEMGNVYLSGIHYTISDVSNRKTWSENLAFPNFLEWLIDYLAGMHLL